MIVTVFCKCQDCKFRTKDVTEDGFGLCSNTEAGMIVIIPGENGPMCETYERVEEAEA